MVRWRAGVAAAVTAGGMVAAGVATVSGSAPVAARTVLAGRAVLAGRVVLGGRAVAAGGSAARSAGTGLPAAAVGEVSRIVGRSESGYRISRAGHALVAHSRPQRLAARFGASGVVVRSGAVRVRVRPIGYGYGGRLVPVRPVRPAAAANRVVYRSGPLSSWYTNGPAGLEQGFTLAGALRLGGTVPAEYSRHSLAPGQAGAAARHGALALALSVRASAPARMSGGGVVFRAGRSDLAYRDLVAHDARGRRLRAWLSLAPGRLLLHVAAAGARYPLTIDPVFQQLAVLTSGSPSNTDNLGWSVALSGNTIVAGAPGASISGGGSHVGAVFVFTEPPGGWVTGTQSAELYASDGVTSDGLGVSVGIHGGTIVAGAPFATEGPNAEQGALYVFSEPAGGWVSGQQSAEITASDGGAGDDLGAAVGIDGGTIVAGAPGATLNTNADQGAAYVFTGSDGIWAAQAKLTAAGGAANDRFGSTLAISGNSVVVGAPGANSNAGAAYEFTEPDGGWVDGTQTTQLMPSGGAVSFGLSVAIAGATAVVGAPATTVGGNVNQGAAYVFTAPGGDWLNAAQVAVLTASDGQSGDVLGESVAIAGHTIAVGAPSHGAPISGGNMPPPEGTGAVYVYTEPAGGWSDEAEDATITLASGDPNNRLGRTLAISPDLVAAGAFRHVPTGAVFNPGVVYVFGPPSGPPPPPVSYRLAGFSAPRRGSRWRPRRTVPVSTVVTYADGAPIPGWLAAELGANCELTLAVSGAQRLAGRCLRWNPASQRFTYRWHSGRHTGRVTLQVNLYYKTPATITEPIRIVHRHR